MAVQDDGPPGGGLASRGQSLREIVVQLAPAIHVAARAPGSAVAALVERMDIETGRGQLVAHVLVAARVFRQAVDQQDGGPW